MSSTNVGPGVPGVQLDSASDASPAEAQGADWLVERTERSRPRHAAITRNLQTWSSYKSWAEQVRESWEPGAAGGENDTRLTEAAAKK